jgi:hypothetical protein
MSEKVTIALITLLAGMFSGAGTVWVKKGAELEEKDKTIEGGEQLNKQLAGRLEGLDVLLADTKRTLDGLQRDLPRVCPPPVAAPITVTDSRDVAINHSTISKGDSALSKRTADRNKLQQRMAELSDALSKARQAPAALTGP